MKTCDFARSSFYNTTVFIVCLILFGFIVYPMTRFPKGTWNHVRCSVIECMIRRIKETKLNGMNTGN